MGKWRKKCKKESCAPNLHQIRSEMCLFNVPKYRRALSQLRVSSHRLAVETGRYLRPPIPAIERICKYCHLQNIDDDLYFITECDFRAIERDHLYEIVKKYFPNFIAKNNRDRFVDILTSPGGDQLRTLRKYIFKGFKTRDANVI